MASVLDLRRHARFLNRQTVLYERPSVPQTGPCWCRPPPFPPPLPRHCGEHTQRGRPSRTTHFLPEAHLTPLHDSVNTNHRLVPIQHFTPLGLLLLILLPLHAWQGTPPPSTRQKKRVPWSRSSLLQAVATLLLAQHSSLDIFSPSSSVQRPLRTIADQQLPPAPTNNQIHTLAQFYFR